MVSQPDAARPLDERLRQDHEWLEQQFEKLLGAFRANAQTELRTLWSELDVGLSSHLEAEEKYVLPALRAVDPSEVDALIEQHNEIRRLLVELGVGVDLHVVRDEVATAFVQALRTHASRENKLLYQWAERNLNAPARQALQMVLGQRGS